MQTVHILNPVWTRHFLTTTMPDIGVNLRITGSCNQGDRKYMEDFFTVAYHHTKDMQNLEFVFIGIFDGHGGSEAATYVKDHLLGTIIKDNRFWSKNDKDVLKAIRNGYVNTHYEMWKNLENWSKTPTGLPSVSGTTASIAFIMRGKIYTGHVGDSRIVLGYQDEEYGEWKAKPLTQDHKPESIEEKLRIEGCGGKVINKSGVSRVVWSRPRIDHKGPVRRSTAIRQIPLLAVARALGDFWSFNYEHNKFVVSPEPDVGVFNVDPSKHRCLIFGTDGLWNVLSADVAILNVYETEKHNIEMSYLEKNDWLNPSKNLVDKALLQWKFRLKADNITVITLMLDLPSPSDPQDTNKINHECVDGDPHIQEFRKSSCSGFTILTRYPTDHHLNACHALASTSKSSTIATLPIKTNKVLGTLAKLSNNYDDINDSSCKVSSPPTEKESTCTSSGGNVTKKQKLHTNSTNADYVSSKFGNSHSENDQLPREPQLISPNKSI